MLYERHQMRRYVVYSFYLQLHEREALTKSGRFTDVV